MTLGVQLVAATQLLSLPEEYEDHVKDWSQEPADELAEFAGRACYESWNRPNPETATNKGYLGNILGHQHFSVLEHASATFWITGVSRTLTHELVRHRHLSFSQVSQRYVDESEREIKVPPGLDGEGDLIYMLRDLDQFAKQLYQTIAEALIAEGKPKKEARQTARAALLGCQTTKIVVTGNLRAWREVIQKRNSPAADTEIRELAASLLVHLKRIAPNTFQDMQ
jgi:thymidylate synthase (FAD)